MNYLHVGAVALLSLPAATPAAESTDAGAVELSLGVTATALAADDSDVDPTLAGSFDLVLEKRSGPHTWVVYVEGSSSVHADSVAAVYPEANADAGTALVNGNQGTVQVSELKYRWSADADRHVTVGVVDTAAYMDLSGTANDENSQFLNAWLVNNAAIEFPDYTPGLVYEAGGEAFDLFALLTSSHGIADNADNSWAQLLDLDAQGKGAFAAAGLRSAGEVWSWEAGAWHNSADHTTLDGSESGRSNFGAYGVVGAAAEGMAFDVRLGYADPTVSETELFASGSLAFEFGDMTLGLAYAQSQLSSDAAAPGRDDASVSEIYLQMPLAGVALAFDLQMLRNPGFDADAGDAVVGGVRVHYEM